jgi:hypothetical protein
MDRACSTHGVEEECIQGFGAETRCIQPLGRISFRLENNIKIDLRGLESECMNWIILALDVNLWRALVNTVMNLRVV